MQVKKQQLEPDIEKRTGSKLEKEYLKAVYRKLTNLITWTTALSNSMKLRAMPYRATQDEWVMVKSSDKMWSTGEGKGKPLQYSCLENPSTVSKGKKTGH